MVHFLEATNVLISLFVTLIVLAVYLGTFKIFSFLE